MCVCVRERWDWKDKDKDKFIFKDKDIERRGRFTLIFNVHPCIGMKRLVNKERIW